MMKYILIIFFFVEMMCGALIVGDQYNVSVLEGNAYVESRGVKKVIKAGEVIFISENNDPTEANTI